MPMACQHSNSAFRPSTTEYPTQATVIAAHIGNLYLSIFHYELSCNYAVAQLFCDNLVEQVSDEYLIHTANY